MRLGWKLFISYLAVVSVGLLVLALSTSYVAPETFSAEMYDMQHMGQGRGMMMGHGPERWSDMLAALENDLDAAFRRAVNSALWRAGVAATLTAGLVSLFVAQLIVRPLRQVVKASQHIAEGHYDQRLPARMNDELGELFNSFNRMAAALADTETMRQQLLADVSHELKTPLASIKGYMEGLQDGVIAPTPDTFQLIHREADRLQRLVRDLQELSRAEAGAFQLNKRPHSPAYLVETVMLRLQPQFADKAVSLTSDCPASLPDVLADEDRVEQVLTNLLGNALQYTPEGGRVTVRLRPVESAVLFSVEDTGIGLVGDDLTRIFQRFYRVDRSRSRSSGGSGIGLTIARHIVEAHGGKIWAESPGLNQGSTFHFTLPRA